MLEPTNVAPPFHSGGRVNIHFFKILQGSMAVTGTEDFNGKRNSEYFSHVSELISTERLFF